MRCLALAQAWQDAGGSAVFIMAAGNEALGQCLTSEQIDIVRLDVEPGSLGDAQATAKQALDAGAQWVVLDGYHFGCEYHRILKESGLRLLCIDDTGGLEHYRADLVLNQNLHADESLYRKRESYTQLLLGTRYALLRRGFCGFRDWNRQIPPLARKVLVSFGGADPDNATLKAVQAIAELKDLEAKVVVGQHCQHYDTLLSATSDMPNIEILRSKPDQMAELMAWADVAISAAGSTCWELAFMTLPAILLVLAANQRDIGSALERLGLAKNLGWHAHVLPEQIAEILVHMAKSQVARTAMSQRGRTLSDGLGAQRVTETLLSVQ